MPSGFTWRTVMAPVLRAGTAMAPTGSTVRGLMQRLRRVFLAIGVAGLFAALFRVRGKGGTPPSDGGWRQLEGPELR